MTIKTDLILIWEVSASDFLWQISITLSAARRMISFVFLTVLFLAGCHGQANHDMCYKTSNPLGTCECDQQLFINEDCTQAEQNSFFNNWFFTRCRRFKVGSWRLEEVFDKINKMWRRMLSCVGLWLQSWVWAEEAEAATPQCTSTIFTRMLSSQRSRRLWM